MAPREEKGEIPVRESYLEMYLGAVVIFLVVTVIQTCKRFPEQVMISLMQEEFKWRLGNPGDTAKETQAWNVRWPREPSRIPLP